ncbi:MAG: IS1096 element passenger TnpR family protein [Desulfitobacteriaceae bacterium]
MSTQSILRVSELEPTPLVRDFGVFAEFLSNNRVMLTPKSQHLAKATLHQLNKLMATYVTEDNPNFNQLSYPLLNLFYHLALNGKLLRKVQAKGDRYELQPTERYNRYQDLRSVEKYFFLLETLWIQVDWKELNSTSWRYDVGQNIGNVFKFVSKQVPNKVIKVDSAQDKIFKHLLDSLNQHVLTLSFFGLWEVTKDEEAVSILYSKYDFRASTFTPSEFGVVMAATLATVRDLPSWNVPIRREYGEDNLIPGASFSRHNKYILIQDIIKEFKTGKKTRYYKQVKSDFIGEQFIQAFSGFFAPGELDTTLIWKQPKTDGNYTFKVLLNKKTWRRIVLSGKHTLEDMHMIIQEAFEFNNDHLYSFFMDGKAWSHNSFKCTYVDQGPYVTEAIIGELGLESGDEILYLFDYGDQWEFKVLLEHKDEGGSRVLKPVITARHGESPEQYPSWDE